MCSHFVTPFNTYNRIFTASCSLHCKSNPFLAEKVISLTVYWLWNIIIILLLSWHFVVTGKTRQARAKRGNWVIRRKGMYTYLSL